MYNKLGPREARRVLATIFPSGSATKVLEERLTKLKERSGFIDEEGKMGVIDSLVQNILEAYSKDPNFKRLT